MSFKLNIENFGKLSNEEVRIGQFTVFAGPNNTGKSSVSKLLYSLFDGMNVNHALVHFDMLVDPLREGLSDLEKWGYEEDEDLSLSLLNDELDKMENLVKSFPIDNSEKLGERWNQVVDSTSILRRKYRELKPNIERWAQKDPFSPSGFSSPPSISDMFAGVLSRTEKALDELCKRIIIEETDVHQFVEKGIQYKISQNLIQNFQVRNLSLLRNQQEEPSKVFIDSVGTFEFKNSELVNFKISQTGFEQLQHYSRVIYLESPVYWKLQSALENVRMSPRFLYRDRNRLSGVPGYFYDLAWALREEYSGDIAFPELCEKLTSDKFIGGKLKISETGELSFHENERNFSLHLTAMGVINLGILALLIERKIIDKGTFLFIDEPEAHLHPSWQIKITRTLFELSCLGVNVVIATHSADILKFLEVEVKKNPESKEFIEVNHFTSDGVKNYGDDFDSNLAKIKEELTDPYTKLYFAGL